MALTVKETKAGSRPAGGYPISAPTLSARPLNLRTDTLVKARPIRSGPSQKYRRIGVAKPVIGPLGLRPRVILP